MSKVRYPLPIMDLSSNGFMVVSASAGREHIGYYAPEERLRLRPTPQQLAWASRAGRSCLYCCSPDPVGGEEHVLSVALGNWFWVLPPNVVCGRCNHGVLSVLDTKLQQDPLVSMVRVLADVRGRTGQPARAGASNVRLARGDDGRLKIETNHERHVLQRDDEIAIRTQWSNWGPRQRRNTARALLKFALGVVWLAKGPDEAFASKYDHVRSAVIDDNQVPIKYGVENPELPSHAVQGSVITHESLRGLRVSLTYLGISLWAETDGFREDADQSFLAEAV